MISRIVFQPLRPSLSTKAFRSVSPTSRRPVTSRKMHIQSIPMSVGKSNNYAYIVTDESSKDSVVIDPAFPEDIWPTLGKQVNDGSIKLNAIVNTHHHWDHSGGNDKINGNLPSKVPIIGGKDCQSVSKTPSDRSKFSVGSIEVTALYTPCHTQDSICWFFEDHKTNQRAVFTGDTLFIGGCGRFFEGTPPEMEKALNETLASLPDDTKVYPGHEYTKANVKFLASVAPKDPEVLRLQKHAEENKETPGLSTMGDEKKWNLFMRTAGKDMQEVTGKTDPADVMGVLREMKNKS